MNQEPAHFLNMFNGTFVTLLGGVEKGEADKDTDGVMLFRVRADCNNVWDKKPLVRTNQVEELKSSINSEDVFILKTAKQLMMYIGKVLHQNGPTNP